MNSFLTRRGLGGLAMGAAMAATGARCAMHKLPLVPAQPSASFRHGIGIHGAFNWPDLAPGSTGSNEVYAWPPFAKAQTLLSSRNLSNLRAAGFDFIRLTVNPHIFISLFDSPEYATAEAILAGAIRAIHGAGLSVIVDIHSISRDPEFATDALIAPAPSIHLTNVAHLVERMTRMLVGMPVDKVALELWNEPRISAGRDSEWDDAQYSLYRIARQANPRLSIIVAGINTTYVGIQNLRANRYNDGNTYFSFHYYDPVPFTHQGSINPADPTDVPQYFSHVPYPLSPTEAHDVVQAAVSRARARTDLSAGALATLISNLQSRERYLNMRGNGTWLAAKFGEIEAWRVGFGIDPKMIIMGEFGASRRTCDSQSHEHWLQDLRLMAEQRHYCWALWSFEEANAFGLATNNSDFALDKGMLYALGLRVRLENQG